MIFGKGNKVWHNKYKVVSKHRNVQLYKPVILDTKFVLCLYTKSLVNTNSVYTNFTNTHFQKVPIPHLTRTMQQNIPKLTRIYLHVVLTNWLT